MLKRQLWLLLALLFILTACGQSYGNDSSSLREQVAVENDALAPSEKTIPSGDLIVHYIDVDQGDATLLQSPEFTMLIDTGRHDRNEVVPYLKSVGVERIDILVGTHPHADHIGQMDKVLQNFAVEEVWMSGDTHTSKTFERVLDAVIHSGANYVEPRTGDVFEIGSAIFTILHPDQLTGDLNGGSIAIHLTYGEISFLFTGDAEAQQEDTMIGSGLPLQAHIFQLGHHGSSTSNTQPFIENIQPELAIYSAGAGNSYGHPHKEVIQRLASMDIPVYGTDDYGTIILETDGTDYELTVSKEKR